MDVAETIKEAAKRFGVPVTDILAGRRCRNAHVLIAREWIVAQFPDMSANALSKAMGFRNHGSVIEARRRIASNTCNVDNGIKR